MTEIVFATNNENKRREISQLLGDKYKILTLADIGCNEDIPETQDTIEGNAIQKAEYIYKAYGKNCFADDTGLLIDALNGEPGVLSARYAGPQRNSSDNIRLVLKNLEGQDSRSAHFKTVICLILDGKITTFEGIAKGEITDGARGLEGFGYDPIFQPEGETRTFAQMGILEKNKVSHRGKAVNKLCDFINLL